MKTGTSAASFSAEAIPWRIAARVETDGRRIYRVVLTRPFSSTYTVPITVNETNLMYPFRTGLARRLH